MSQALPEEWFVTDSRPNAWVTWFLTVVLVVSAVGYLLAGLLVEGLDRGRHTRAWAVQGVKPAEIGTDSELTFLDGAILF